MREKKTIEEELVEEKPVEIKALEVKSVGKPSELKPKKAKAKMAHRKINFSYTGVAVIEKGGVELSLGVEIAGLAKSINSEQAESDSQAVEDSKEEKLILESRLKEKKEDKEIHS